MRTLLDVTFGAAAAAPLVIVGYVVTFVAVALKTWLGASRRARRRRRTLGELSACAGMLELTEIDEALDRLATLSTPHR
ncbi:MAG TPA: hypothetical protein VMU75_13500 [Acidimicrobiales bacterium]|nr:hypothetical protein [Acidimicrobiales bacterium]